MNNYRKSHTWKIQLKIAIHFILSEEIGKERVMHSKDDNTEIMISDKADKVIEQRFQSFLLGIKLDWKHQ